MLQDLLGDLDLAVAAVRALVPHLQDLAAAHLAHVHHDIVGAWRQGLLAAALPLSMAAVVVDDLVPVQVQEGTSRTAPSLRI